VSSKTELDALATDLASLDEQLAASGITVEKAKEFLTSANTSLGTSISNDSSGGGSCSSSLHFVGYSTDSSNKTIPGYWVDGTWTGLALKDTYTGGRVYSVVCKGGSLYFVGFQTVSAGLNESGYWLNGEWTALPPLEQGKTCSAFDAQVVGSDLYVAGNCNNASNKSTAGYWKNGVWTSLPNSHPDAVASVGRITVGANNDIYISGTLGNSNWAVGYWLNGTWNALTTTGVGSGSLSVNTVVLNGTSVLVSGTLPYPGNSFVATLWTDNVMSTQTYPSGKVFCNSRSMMLDGADIYQIGTCRDSQPVFQPFYWKNGTAVALPILDNTKSGEVSVIRKIGSDIYIPGGSANSSGVTVPGYWKNDVWTALPALDAAKSSIVWNVGP
jgi:hypothetical protein